MDTQQPMKMAAAEAVYKTQSGASFSLLTIGNLSGQPIFQIRIPHLLSLIATLSWNGKVTGVDPGPARGGAEVRAGQLRAGAVGHLLELPDHGRARLPDPDRVRVGAVAVHGAGGKPFELGRWTLWVLVACIAAPFLANTFGWLFTEMGRQPWIVYGLMKTGLAGVAQRLDGRRGRHARQASCSSTPCSASST